MDVAWIIFAVAGACWVYRAGRVSGSRAGFAAGRRQRAKLVDEAFVKQEKPTVDPQWRRLLCPWPRHHWLDLDRHVAFESVLEIDLDLVRGLAQC